MKLTNALDAFKYWKRAQPISSSLDAGVRMFDRPVYGWKGLTKGAVAKVVIPPGNRVVVPGGSTRSSSTSRNKKYRTEKLFVVSTGSISTTTSPVAGYRIPGVRARAITYKKWEYVEPDFLSEDIYQECDHGLHFCPNKVAARKWSE